MPVFAKKIRVLKKGLQQEFGVHPLGLIGEQVVGDTDLGPFGSPRSQNAPPGLDRSVLQIDAVKNAAITVFVGFHVVEDLVHGHRGIAALNPLGQLLSTRGRNALHRAAAPNGLLELGGVAALQNELDVRGMGLQNSPQKRLGLGRQIVGALEPQNGRFSAAPPDMELLPPLPQRAILAAGTGQQQLALLLGVGLDPIALADTRRPRDNKG